MGTWLYMDPQWYQRYIGEIGIVFISLFLFLLSLMRFGKRAWRGELVAEELYRLGGYFYAEGRPLRLLVSTFVHNGVGHLYANLFSIGMYAFILENISDLNSIYRLVIFLSASIFATVLSGIRLNRNVVTVGASGGAMGLGGAVLYVLFTNRFNHYMNDTFFVVILITLINDFSLQFISNLKSGAKVNLRSHIWGLVVGFMTAYVMGNFMPNL